MSEVRAPDPTLDALGEYADVIVQRGARPVPVAHLSETDGTYGDDHRSPCGLRSNSVTSAEEARWWAVPCRDCWPDAPPRGVDPLSRPNAGRYLRWQTGT